MRRASGPEVPLDERWNHNIHHHAVILDALPERGGHVLDAGCGEGVLAHALAGRADRVTAIDRDPAVVELARRHAGAPNVDHVVGDLLSHPFEPASFDAVVSVAAVHHVGEREAFRRLRELVRPGGVVVVVGLARSGQPLDYAYDAVSAVATRVHRLRKVLWESSAPIVWPPPHTYAGVHRIAAEELPGSRFRHHVLWRYSVVWTRPPTG